MAGKGQTFHMPESGTSVFMSPDLVGQEPGLRFENSMSKPMYKSINKLRGHYQLIFYASLWYKSTILFKHLPPSLSSLPNSKVNLQ